MRTIKFRGKRCDNGEWVYGHYLESTKTWHGCHPHKAWILTDAMTNGGFFALLGRHAVINESVGQFTGLYDKNGEEVYEGDILRYPAEDKFDEENFVSFEVFWHDNDCAYNHVGWQMNRHHFHGNICGTRDISTFLPKYTKKMVVIGNIHDNPELLKGGEK